MAQAHIGEYLDDQLEQLLREQDREQAKLEGATEAEGTVCAGTFFSCASDTVSLFTRSRMLSSSALSLSTSLLFSGCGWIAAPRKRKKKKNKSRT